MHKYGKLKFRKVKWLFQGPKTELKFDPRSNDKDFARRISLIMWALNLCLGPCSNINTLTETNIRQLTTIASRKLLLHTPIYCSRQAEISETATLTQIRSKLALYLWTLDYWLTEEASLNMHSLPHLELHRFLVSLS